MAKLCSNNNVLAPQGRSPRHVRSISVSALPTSYCGISRSKTRTDSAKFPSISVSKCRSRKSTIIPRTGNSPKPSINLMTQRPKPVDSRRKSFSCERRRKNFKDELISPSLKIDRLCGHNNVVNESNRPQFYEEGSENTFWNECRFQEDISTNVLLKISEQNFTDATEEDIRIDNSQENLTQSVETSKHSTIECKHMLAPSKRNLLSTNSKCAKPIKPTRFRRITAHACNSSDFSDNLRRNSNATSNITSRLIQRSRQLDNMIEYQKPLAKDINNSDCVVRKYSSLCNANSISADMKQLSGEISIIEIV